MAENFLKNNFVRQINQNANVNLKANLNKNINNNNIIKTNNPPNEYYDLSYLRNKNPHSPNLNENKIPHCNCNSNCHIIPNNQNSEISKAKKSIELDFKIKYKTEKCKFWEINQTCKFGDNVKFIFTKIY